MSSWKFDPEKLTIRNLVHGHWEIDLRQVKGKEDLLQWILQAAQHNFNMLELFEEFRLAIMHCFKIDGANGAAMLQELFEARALGVGPVDWSESSQKSEFKVR